ncbi:hypothetical protein [Halobacillus sp. Marseille-P3879]|uniref:hypothetical protein n=1 Tax=Halobacillus TaxID=45667 RepID=UPI000C7DC236|nr:hypothetical protein [Halobacillus sp. Marseille-P3879]
MNVKGAAIASLVLGILSIIFPFAGLILGIMGVIFSRKVMKVSGENEGYRGVAKGGMICSVIGICLQILFVLSAVLGVALFWSFT